MALKRTIRQEMAKIDMRILVIFMIACIVVVTWSYYIEGMFTSGKFLRTLFKGASNAELSLYQSMGRHIGSVLMLFIVPLISLILLNKFSSIKLSPLSYTFTLGDYKAGLIISFLFVFIFVSILLIFFVTKPSHFYIYPMSKSSLVIDSLTIFFLFQLSQCIYFIGFEYFFRGFLLLEMERLYGYNAIAITLLPYIIIKIGKPPVEIYTAIIVGIVLGYMTIRSKSFWYSVLAHGAIATINDVMALYVKTH